MNEWMSGEELFSRYMERIRREQIEREAIRPGVNAPSWWTQVLEEKYRDVSDTEIDGEVIRASAESAMLRHQMMTGDPALIGDGIRDIITTVNDWLDRAVAGTYKEQPLAQDWDRVAKCAEEISEVLEETRGRDLSAHDHARINECTIHVGQTVDALIKYTGGNPRKGVCGTEDAMLKELADVAMTAMFAIEHFTGDSEVTAAILAGALGKAMRRATGEES